MKRIVKLVAFVIAIMVLSVSICSCGLISIDNGDTTTTTNAEKRKYNVGETCTSENKFKITYNSCNKYFSDNMFIQPKEGNEYVILSFTIENITSKKEYISYDFDCYADGTKCDKEYFADSSLTIGEYIDAGKKVKGSIVFEVPIGASEIEVEYKASYRSDVITFVVTYDKNQTTTIEETTTPIVENNRFVVGEVCNVGGKYEITYESCEIYVSDNMFIQPKEGYEYIKLSFTIKSLIDKEQYISYDFECYADGLKCDAEYLSESTLYIGENLGAGRTVKGAIIFEVPINATEIEVEYKSSYYSSEKIIFVAK